ncbi:uncharacterized protein LOC128199826 [Bicyclus anynana]|uniref:Zinc finger CCHC domain-containing protein 7 n=1 Tax=Bicyclus anynana TaxID=110368 RepID=A0ABM3M657_BICAN|nr:uncharacterized protein LOC128199826 [Bicyclus anynana]
MENDENDTEYTQGKGSKRKKTPGGELRQRTESLGGGMMSRKDTLGDGSYMQVRGEAPGGGSHLRRGEAPGGGSHLRRGEAPGGESHLRRGEAPGGESHLRRGEAPGGESHLRRGEAPGGGSHLRNSIPGGGLRLQFRKEPERVSGGGNMADSDTDSCVGESRKETSRRLTDQPQRLYKRSRTLRSQGRKKHHSVSSDTEEELHTNRNRKSRSKRRHAETKNNETSDSLSSVGESPPTKRSKTSKRKDEDMMDKFLAILKKVKSSDKPKITFNTNVVPEFDPLSKDQSILTWINKVEECAEIYGWEEREIIHYSLPKLTGVARTWYQGLTSILHTWPEWKKKLIESFPCKEDYAELLTEMLSKRVKYGESLEHYYYAKVNLLNRCKISGKQAVDCLLHGVEDRAIKVGAQAAQFREPEQVLKYFKTVKLGISRDHDNMRKGRYAVNTNEADSSKSGNSFNQLIRCINCNELGHPSLKCDKASSSGKCHNCDEVGHRSFKCEKPPSRCTTCNRFGHLTSNCYKNVGRSTIETKTTATSGNDLNHKQISEVMTEDVGINKYVMDITVNGSTVSSHIDMGSQCSLIRESEVKCLNLQMTPRDKLPTLRGIGGNLVSPLGVVVATVEVQGVAATIDLYVVENYVLMHPVLLGHSFTERPDILIIKTPEEIKFQRIVPNKISLVANHDCEIPSNTMRAVQISTGCPMLNCVLYVKGTLCGPDGKEYYLLPGQYEIKLGRGAILIHNITPPKPLSIVAGTLLTRSVEQNKVSADNIKNSFSVVFNKTTMDTSVTYNPR